jgi:hypothetical protein
VYRDEKTVLRLLENTRICDGAFSIAIAISREVEVKAYRRFDGQD